MTVYIVMVDHYDRDSTVEMVFFDRNEANKYAKNFENDKDCKLAYIVSRPVF